VRLAHAVAHAGIARGADLLLLFAQGEVDPRARRGRALPQIVQEPLVPQRGGQRAAQAEGPALAQGVQRHEPAQGIAEDAAVLRPGQQRTARLQLRLCALDKPQAGRRAARKVLPRPDARLRPGREVPVPIQRLQGDERRGPKPLPLAPRQGAEGLGQVHRLLRRPVDIDRGDGFPLRLRRQADRRLRARGGRAHKLCVHLGSPPFRFPHGTTFAGDGESPFSHKKRAKTLPPRAAAGTPSA